MPNGASSIKKPTQTWGRSVPTIELDAAETWRLYLLTRDAAESCRQERFRDQLADEADKYAALAKKLDGHYQQLVTAAKR